MGLLEENFYCRLLFGCAIGLNIIRLDFINPRLFGELMILINFLLILIFCSVLNSDLLVSTAGNACKGICEADAKLAFFAFCGWALAFIALILSGFARLYQIKLMECADVRGVRYLFPD